MWGNMFTFLYIIKLFDLRFKKVSVSVWLEGGKWILLERWGKTEVRTNIVDTDTRCVSSVGYGYHGRVTDRVSCGLCVNEVTLLVGREGGFKIIRRWRSRETFDDVGYQVTLVYWMTYRRTSIGNGTQILVVVTVDWCPREPNLPLNLNGC